MNLSVNGLQRTAANPQLPPKSPRSQKEPEDGSNREEFHPNPPACRQDARLSAAACAADVPTADAALAAAAAAAVARAEAAAHADDLGDSAVARAALLSYETRGQT